MLAMLKKCSCFERTRNIDRESRRKNGLDEASITTSFSLQQKDLYVRIVRKGGFVDLYRYAVSASQVMEKYPGMCVTRPEVFKRPHESLVQPEEKLQPGQKFYLVPRSTIQKLKRKFPEMLQVEESTGMRLEEELSGSKMVAVEDEDFSAESISAKDFFVSPERWSRSVLRRSRQEVKKPFVPPIKGARMWQGLAWEPSLPTVKELSP
ncbi:Protein of unknown function DUF4228 [Macleaya cordata]|uniref:Uncharacterized protein n=1 Tax=Macleaya cordata TaxID=56857 RepID=A0A200RDL7_MACCD|nr:Protein of unknown function DUF4228 [Macleaya cordata]